MIHYLTTIPGETTVRGYLESRGRALSPVFRAVRYEDLFTWAALPRGCYVFADLERLSAPALERAEATYRLLEGQEGVALHNRPSRCALKERFQPLMHELGVNSFTSYPATRFPESIRYPVFLRHQKRHDGPETPLLPDAKALARALGDVWLRRIDLDHVAVVEFVETMQPDGYRRFFSGFLVGGRIVIRYTLTSRGWVQKKWETITPEMVREEAEYVRRKPHEGWMREVFAHAGIDYGRLDFGLAANGRLEAWEINTNPGFVRAADAYPKELLDISRFVGDAFEAALRALDVASSLPPIPVPSDLPAAPDADEVTPLRKVRRRSLLNGLLRMPGIRRLSAAAIGRRLYERAVLSPGGGRSEPLAGTIRRRS